MTRLASHSCLPGLLVFLSLSTGMAMPATAQLFPVAADVAKKIEEAQPRSANAKPLKERRVLLFSKTNGFRHGSIPVGAKSIVMLGEKTGAFDVTHSEDDSMFEPETLNQFDAVIMLNTTGELFRPGKLPDDEQEKEQVLKRESRLKQSLMDFVKSG